MSIPRVSIPVPHSDGTGELLDITQFVYDPTNKRWAHRLRVAVDAIRRYTDAAVTKDNLASVGTPILNELGFRPSSNAQAVLCETADEVQTPVPVAETAEPTTGKRGRQSKYPYKTMGIGESFLIDADAVGITLNHSLLSDRGFEIKVVGGRFKVTRTK